MTHILLLSYCDPAEVECNYSSKKLRENVMTKIGKGPDKKNPNEVIYVKNNTNLKEKFDVAFEFFSECLSNKVCLYSD